MTKQKKGEVWGEYFTVENWETEKAEKAVRFYTSRNVLDGYMILKMFRKIFKETPRYKDGLRFHIPNITHGKIEVVK